MAEQRSPNDAWRGRGKLPAGNPLGLVQGALRGLGREGLHHPQALGRETEGRADRAFPFTRGWETTTPSFVMAREKTFSSSSGEFQPWAVLPLKEAGFYRSPLCSDMSGLTRGGVNRERCTQSRLWFPAKYKHPLVLIYTIFLLN